MFGGGKGHAFLKQLGRRLSLVFTSVDEAEALPPQVDGLLLNKCSGPIYSFEALERTLAMPQRPSGKPHFTRKALSSTGPESRVNWSWPSAYLAGTGSLVTRLVILASAGAGTFRFSFFPV